MLVLGLITCIVLRALSAQAKVVDSFEECGWFFYQGKEPTGMDQNAKKICQQLGNSESFYYATLYSASYKIPLYSAYTLDPKCKCDKNRPTSWHIEQQISKENQAINRDYSGTGYDRGHLNPSCFQCDDGRKATFTLTNAAPMKERFNRVHWWNWESQLRDFLLKREGIQERNGDSAKAYIVTGTVPNPNVLLPHDTTSDGPQTVSVPSHIWTAVCYKHNSDDTKSFSFGYIGKNQQEEPGIRLMKVSDLNDQLKGLYSELSGTDQSITIFDDHCSGDNNKLDEVMVAFQKLIDQRVNQAKQMKKCITRKRTCSSDRTPKKKSRRMRGPDHTKHVRVLW